MCLILCLLSPRSHQPKKLSFGNFGRKKKQEESEEYVCPMDVEMPKGRSFQKGFELQIYEDDLDRLEQVRLHFRKTFEQLYTIQLKDMFGGGFIKCLLSKYCVSLCSYSLLCIELSVSDHRWRTLREPSDRSELSLKGFRI